MIFLNFIEAYIIGGFIIFLILNGLIKKITMRISINDEGIAELKYGIFISLLRIKFSKWAFYRYKKDFFRFGFCTNPDPLIYKELNYIVIYRYPFNGKSISLNKSIKHWDGLKEIIYSSMKNLNWELVVEFTVTLGRDTFERKYFKDPNDPAKYR
jgi:hypothetical protein